MTMRYKGLLVLTVIGALAVAAVFITQNSQPVAALQGSNCAPYRLPSGAEVIEIGYSATENTITISYGAPTGMGTLVVPFDTIAPTCDDLALRSVVTLVQKEERKLQAMRCKFVADLLAGRVQLPPGLADGYDLEYATEWYQTVCR